MDLALQAAKLTKDPWGRNNTSYYIPKSMRHLQYMLDLLLTLRPMQLLISSGNHRQCHDSQRHDVPSAHCHLFPLSLCDKDPTYIMEREVWSSEYERHTDKI